MGADRLRRAFLPGGPSLTPLKEQAKVLNAKHLAEQIRRMESSIEADPSLAIGTAKELIETCCKTILAERGQACGRNPRCLHAHERHAERVEADPGRYPRCDARRRRYQTPIEQSRHDWKRPRRTPRSLWNRSWEARHYNRIGRTPREVSRGCRSHIDHLSFRYSQGDRI